MTSRDDDTFCLLVASPREAGVGVVVEGVLGESLSLAVCGGEMEGCKEMRIGLDKRFYLNSVCVIPSTRG